MFKKLFDLNFFARVNLPGLLQGVTVGEKFGPAGVLSALGVTALMPRSFSIDASPRLTENVEQEFRRDRPDRGVDGAEGCREGAADAICEDIWDGGRLKVTAVVPSSGCITVLLVKVYVQPNDWKRLPGCSSASSSTSERE